MNKVKVPDCRKCEFRKKYDYGKKIYYCDNEGRSNDMGKLGVGELLETSPVWCPLRENDKSNKKYKFYCKHKILKSVKLV